MPTTPNKPKPTSLPKKLALLLSSLLISLALAEVTVRLIYPAYGIPIHTTKLFTEFDPKLGWRKIPNFTGQHVQPEYTIIETLNARGQRGPIFPYAKPPNTYRILILGDSFAEGYTVNLPDLFSQTLSQNLNTNSPQKIEVINTGTGGYSTDQELLFFQDEAVKYQPDLTVLLFFKNDLTFNIKDNYNAKSRGQKPLFELNDGNLTLKSLPQKTWSNDEVAADDLEKHPPQESFAPWRPSTWFLYRLTLHTLTAGTQNGINNLPAIPQTADENTRQEKNAGTQDENSGGMAYTYKSARREWQMTEALLAKLNEEVQAADSSLLLYYVPLKGEVYTKNRAVTSKPSALESNLAIVAKRHGIDFLPTTALFQAEAKILTPQNQFLYWKKDPHWTAQGNHLTALILTEYINEHHLPQP